MVDSISYRSSDPRLGRGGVYGDRLKEITSSQASVINVIFPRIFRDDYRVHKALVSSNVDGETTVPLVYYRKRLPTVELGVNSSQSNVTSAALAHYAKVEQSLSDLASDQIDEQRVEKGAIDSALSLVAQLRSRQIAPPELSWHGGDAVVMLWALGDTTFAITVTDGEVGYVVRRNRKAVKIVDSLSLTTFRLEDMR